MGTVGNTSTRRDASVASFPPVPASPWFRAFVVEAPDAVIGLDSRGRIRFANTATERLFGHAPAELIGRRHSTLVAPSDRLRLRGHAAETLAAASASWSGSLALHVRRQDGSWSPVSARLMDLRSDPDVRCLLVILRDLTTVDEANVAGRETEQELRLLADAATDMVARVGVDGTYRYVSPSVSSLLGYQPEDLIGRSGLSLCHPDDLESRPWRGGPGELTAGVFTLRVRMRHADGSWRWIESTNRSMPSASGDGTEVLAAARDVTARVELEQALAEREAGYRQLVETAQEGIARLDVDGNFQYVNQRHADLLGRTPEEIVGHHVSEFVNPASSSVVEHRVGGRRTGVSERFEIAFHRPDGEQVWALVSSSPLRQADGTVTGAMSLVTDITELKRAQERLRHVALHDSLTGLPNRHLCEERLDAALGLASDARSDRPARPVTVAVCDVDQFKLINDTYGHAAGDHVLEVVAGRLRASVRADDTVGRLGGDEFVVIASDLEGPEAIESFAASLSAELSCPIQLPGSRLDVTVSIGLSSAPANEPGTRQALLREADEAMYAAKRRGRGLAVVFAGEVRERVLRRLAIRAELPRAVAERHFTLAYQPVVDIASEHPAGVEALLRWHSLELGQVPPDEFVPIAEESGVINALGDWVLDEACRQTAEWSRRQGWRDLSVAVNISAHQLATGSGLVGAVRRALLSSRLRPEQLVLELTETALMTDPEGALKVLLDLKRLGVGLAIDDFGTGYSSLVYLKQFPVDVLKVDRSFVAGIPEQADNHAIVTAVTGLARAVSLATVAEGVETREQLAAVRELQCTHGQGYLWSRPVPGAEVPSTLARLQESALQRSARERSAPQRPVPQPSTPRTSADVAR